MLSLKEGQSVTFTHAQGRVSYGSVVTPTEVPQSTHAWSRSCYERPKTEKRIYCHSC